MNVDIRFNRVCYRLAPRIVISWTYSVTAAWDELSTSKHFRISPAHIRTWKHRCLDVSVGVAISRSGLCKVTRVECHARGIR